MTDIQLKRYLAAEFEEDIDIDIEATEWSSNPELYLRQYKCDCVAESPFGLNDGLNTLVNKLEKASERTELSEFGEFEEFNGLLEGFNELNELLGLGEPNEQRELGGVDKQRERLERRERRELRRRASEKQNAPLFNDILDNNFNFNAIFNEDYDS